MLVDNKRQHDRYVSSTDEYKKQDAQRSNISVLSSIAFDMEVEEEGAMSCLYVRRKKHIYIKVTAD